MLWLIMVWHSIHSKHRNMFRIEPKTIGLRTKMLCLCVGISQLKLLKKISLDSHEKNIDCSLKVNAFCFIFIASQNETHKKNSNHSWAATLLATDCLASRSRFLFCMTSTIYYDINQLIRKRAMMTKKKPWWRMTGNSFVKIKLNCIRTRILSDTKFRIFVCVCTTKRIRFLLVSHFDVLQNEHFVQSFFTVVFFLASTIFE